MLISAHDGYPRWVDSGADFLEVDIRRNRDGEIILAHDEPRPGANHTTLDEVLRRMGGRAGLHLDLKQPAYEVEVLEKALGQMPPERIVVTTPLDGSIRIVKIHFPGVRAGLTIGNERPIECDPDFIALDQRYYRTVEMPVWVWTVDNERAMKRYLNEKGIEAIITNRPDLAIRLRKDRS